MKGRKNCKATGGGVFYAGAGSKVAREAEERKKGGRVKEAEKVMGPKPRHRLDRPGRKSGGAVGADKTPLTTAARVTPPGGGKAEEDD